MTRIQICPSILAADFSRLAEEIVFVEKAGADGIHLDVMDGHFVPNLTIGPVVVRSLRKVTKLPFWSHLMIEAPEKYIKAFYDAGSDGIYIHPETGRDMVALSDEIHTLGIQAGITLNPETSVESIESIIKKFDRILIMTVHPGFGGQTFMSDMVEKISTVKRLISSWSSPPLLEVDGGIDVNTAPVVVKAGVDILVSGSAIFSTDDPSVALKEIRKKAEEEIRLV
jgi:ribulose-phosphate 3-epimerase